MKEIISNVVAIIILVILVVWCVKKYNRSNSLIEKIIYVLIPFIYIVPGIIYMLDRCNVPTLLNWDKNLSIERWFDFLSTYSSSIVGAIIGGVIVVFVTIKQIEVQNKNNKSDKKIQNAPIFKYNITNEGIQTENKFYLFNGHGNNYSLLISLENVGLNHARHIAFKISGDDINQEKEFSLNKTQGILKKDDLVTFELIINYKYNESNENKKINIKVIYEDLLENKYMQDICIYGETTNISGSNIRGYKFYIVECKIENEICYEEK